MNPLPEKNALPPGVSREKPANNLTSLTTTASLRTLTKSVLLQWVHAEAFEPLARFGIRPVDRMLFYGPPGNGKTMACHWLGARLNVPVIRVRCEELIGKYLGESAANIGRVMEYLLTQPRTIVLFDEVETIFPSRSLSSGNCGREVSSAMTVFWQYLDRWEAPTLFVLATNMREKLDPALLSRIELQMEFGPPTAEQAALVTEYWSEALHRWGGKEWGPLLRDRTFSSFRELTQEVQRLARAHVVSTLESLEK